MAATNNGRYPKDDLAGPYNAGYALGIALKDDQALVALLGIDIAMRTISQVFLNQGYYSAAQVVDSAIDALVRGYKNGSSKG